MSLNRRGFLGFIGSLPFVSLLYGKEKIGDNAETLLFYQITHISDNRGNLSICTVELEYKNRIEKYEATNLIIVYMKEPFIAAHTKNIVTATIIDNKICITTPPQTIVCDMKKRISITFNKGL